MSQDSKPGRSHQKEADQPQDDAVRGGNGQAGEAEQPSPGESRDPGVKTAEQAETPAPGGSETRADEESLAAQLEAVKAELAAQKDRYLRAAAEAENIRRRADNDIASARKFAVEGFASEVLAVRDSLEIAQSLEISGDDAGAVAKMKEGLDLTLKQLDSALSKFSIEPVDPQKGEKLDPERHQAMSTQESENVPPNHILSVIQKGYKIHDRLLRPAMVRAAKKPQDETQTEGEEA